MTKIVCATLRKKEEKNKTICTKYLDKVYQEWYGNKKYVREKHAMIITRETDYALRILRTLGDGQRHTMKALCEREAIPQQFAYKIIAKLSKAGIVHNTRGSNGGCSLSYDLKQLSLYDLLEVMGEDYQINACMQLGYECTWERNCGSACGIRRKLANIQKHLQDELASHSIYFLTNSE